MKYFIVGNKKGTEFLGGSDFTVKNPKEAMHSETPELIKQNADKLREDIIKYINSSYFKSNLPSFYRDTMLPLLEDYVVYEMEITLKEVKC